MTPFKSILRVEKFKNILNSIQVLSFLPSLSKLFFFSSGNVVMITGGHNIGRVGIIQSRERHPGSFDIVHVKDANGHTFATR
jgi:small subunit ribosomal protein S4e